MLQRERRCSRFFPLFFSLSISFLLRLCLAHEIASQSPDLSRIPVHVSRLSFLSSSVIVDPLGAGILLRRPNDDVTLVHDSLRRITPGFLFPFVQNEERARGRSGRGTLGTDSDVHGRASEQPSLTELLPLRSLHSREAVVYAARHPTDAELMILINVS